MKALITAIGTFGPFSKIEKIGGNFICDGVSFQSTVIGNGATIGELDPTAPPPIVPAFIPMRNARLSLLHFGYLASAQAIIDALGGVEGDAARINWEFAQTVRRDSPLFELLRVELNLENQEVDEMFIYAESIE